MAKPEFQEWDFWPALVAPRATKRFRGQVARDSWNDCEAMLPATPPATKTTAGSITHSPRVWAAMFRSRSQQLPGDLAMSCPRGSDIVMQTHFHPSGKPETEQAELALYFADQPPTKQLVSIQVPAMFGFGANIRVPAGEKNYRVTDSFAVPVATEVIGIGGHAHYICRTMKLTAEFPTGESKVLLQIDDWDLDWQDRYLFAKPPILPAGTVLQAEIVYDNSAENPENPYQPPQEIRWGRESNDEMGAITLLTVASKESERPILQTAVRKHFSETIVNRFTSGPGLAKMLMQLDQDGDGKLQETEAPPRLSGRVFGLLDKNLDGALDSTELDGIADLRARFGAGRQP